MKMKTRRRRKVPVTSPSLSSKGKGSGGVGGSSYESGSASPRSSARVIRRFHVLLKRKAQLERIRTTTRRSGTDASERRESESDLELELKLREIEDEMRGMGGLEVYQRMSRIGQGKDRGGGSEGVFIGWMKEVGLKEEVREKGKGKMKLLEVGAVKPDNYASCSSWIDVLPIDLRSTHPGIVEQDFLEMGVGETNCGVWDAISLSLVVNFVPEPRDRGRMLRVGYEMLRQDGLLFLAVPTTSLRIEFPVRERWKEGGKMGYWLFRKDCPGPRDGSGKTGHVHVRRKPESEGGSSKVVRYDKKDVLREGKRLPEVASRLGRRSQRRFLSSSSTSRSSTGNHPAGSSFGSSPRFAYGLLASVAFFSGVLGYSLNEWTRRGRRASAEGAASTWEDVTYASHRDVQAAIEELRKVLPREGAVNTDSQVLETYGFSENSYHPSRPHAVVVRPLSTEEVSEIVKIANKYGVPVTPYGAGTSLEGHFSGCSGGSICIDMDGMNKILRIDEADGDLVCQAGARWEDINLMLKAEGIPLFFPLDPGPGATIGGMIGTGCSGTNAVRYGTAKGEWFLNVTVVLPNGEIVKTRRRARKSSAGFDTTKLFIGAEGTLGIVTEATLRLAPVLPTKVALAQFPNVQHAVDAVQEILKSPYGNNIQCVELVDDYTISTINKSGAVDRTYPVRDSLFFKIQGSDDSIKATAKLIQGIVKRHSGSNFTYASTQEEASALWEARKYALMSVIAAEEGSRAWTTDVCVPVSKLPQLVQETKEDIHESGLKAGIIGHVGDGNFHALILFHNDEELQKVSECVHRLVHRAIALDGTCTGEHGVGVGKKEYLDGELGTGTVELMRRVKDAIDPKHIMNPGKCGRCDRSYDDEAALKRHLNRKHKGDDGSGGPLADVQVFVESSGQGSTGRLVTPPLSQGSGGSGDSRGSTAGPSTPTVVESPRMRDIQIPTEVVESTEDWYRRCFPDEGTFGPSPPDAQSLSADESALNGHPYYQKQMDQYANAFATSDPAFDTHARYSGDSSLDMVPWPGWDMPMPPYYSQSFNGSGV
ncbi:DLD1_1 [Sanghuangporus sanghuang]